MKLKDALNNLSNKKEEYLLGVPEEELNDLTPNKFGEYDGSLSFRKKVIEEGLTIKTLIAVYWQGWECDEWACIAYKDDKLYKVTTSHGHLEYTEYN